MDKKFAVHCPKCSRYMKIEGHNFRGNKDLGMFYTHSIYFCVFCHLEVPVISDELAFTKMEASATWLEEPLEAQE